MQRAFSFFLGVIFGSLVGATLALLLTPSSGQDIRSEIQNRYIEVRDEVEKAAEDRRAELEQQLAALRRPAKPQA